MIFVFFVLTFIFRFTTDKKYFTGYQKIAAHHTQQIVVKIRRATALPPKKYTINSNPDHDWHHGKY